MGSGFRKAMVVRLWSDGGSLNLSLFNSLCFFFFFLWKILRVLVNFGFFLCVILVGFEMILLQIWLDFGFGHGGWWLWVMKLLFYWFYGL